MLPAHLAWATATNALGVAERSYPTSKVRSRSREDPITEGWRPRGVTPRPRSGAASETARLRRRRNGQEEPPGAAVGRSYPMYEVRGGS